MRVDDPPVGHENNPVLLGEATVVGKAPSGFSSEGKYGTWTSSFDGTLADWNKQNGNIGDNHEEAMDEYQRQVSAIDNRAVKQSVNNAINENATTVAGISVGLPVAIIGGVEAAPLIYKGGKAIGSLAMRQLARYQYWNGSIAEQSSIIYYGVGAKLGTKGVQFINDALPILFEEFGPESPGVNAKQIPIQIGKSVHDIMSTAVKETYKKEKEHYGKRNKK